MCDFSFPHIYYPILQVSEHHIIIPCGPHIIAKLKWFNFNPSMDKQSHAW